MKVYGAENQTHCYECGKQFQPRRITDLGTEFISVRCEPECNRGSWFHVEPTEEFCIPVEIDLRKIRRQIEDALRKNDKLVLKVAELLNTLEY